MKKLFLLTTAILISSIYVKAQTADPELDFIRKAYSSDKKMLVDHYMNLEAADSVKFWPVYYSFETSRGKLARERMDVINEYVNNLSTLTPELADKLSRAALSNTVSLDKLNLDTYEKMKKAIGAINSARYMQLETYLQVTWKVVVQDYIPLIGSLDKTQQK